MSFFDDILKKPLPSADKSYTEGGDMDIEKEMDNMTKEFNEDEDMEPDEGAEFGGVDPILSPDDDEAEEIDSAISVLADELGMEDDDEDEDDDIDYSVEADDLEDEESQAADQMLAVCATPMLLEEACTVEEISQFIESGDVEIAITEGYVMESDINEMLAELSDAEVFTESTFASANQKYKMTKKARFNQLFAMALTIEARAHKDPLYPRLMKAYAIERKIKKNWRQRYGGLAAKRAKGYLKRLMRSKSSTLASAAKRIIGK